MKPEDLERILREDDTIEPSSGFADRVMRAVRDDAADLGPIGFPWSRVVPGLALCAVAVVVGIFAVVGAGPAAPAPGFAREAMTLLSRWFPTDMAVMTLGPLVGSWILVRFSLRLAGDRR